MDSDHQRVTLIIQRAVGVLNLQKVRVWPGIVVFGKRHDILEHHLALRFELVVGFAQHIVAHQRADGEGNH